MIEVSVIVPVRDDPERLARLLAALERQTLPRERFEVVVADDGSRTPVLASRARVTRAEAANSYAARNRGAALARGRILAFTDADCVPEAGWLEAGIGALDHAQLAAGVVCFDVSATRSPWELIDAESYIDQRRWVARHRACTANLFVARPLFDRMGGFDATLPSGGDFDLVRRAARAGAPPMLVEGAVVRHPARSTARAVLRKAWFTTYHGVLRAFRDREPERAGVAYALPLLATVARRRADRRPLVVLDAERLADSGLAPRRRDHLRCIPLIYLLVEPILIVARVAGAARGIALR